MKHPVRVGLSLVLSSLCLGTSPWAAPLQDGGDPGDEPPQPEVEGGKVLDAVTDAPVVRTATPEELDVMLRLFEDAMEEERADAVIEALRRMEMHDNEELAEPAIDALEYEASREDEDAVEEEASLLGISKRSELEEMVIELESEVQAVAARVLTTIPGRKAERALLKRMKDRQVQKDRPITLAAVIAALGARGSEKAADVAEDELKQARDPLLARAAVRYFGQMQTKDEDIVRILISMLDAPEPLDVHAASNPPASYWAARWKTWMETRRDVVWSLKEITGITWKPSDGESPSDSARAMEWLRENGREHGIR